MVHQYRIDPKTHAIMQLPATIGLAMSANNIQGDPFDIRCHELNIKFMKSALKSLKAQTIEDYINCIALARNIYNDIVDVQDQYTKLFDQMRAAEGADAKRAVLTQLMPLRDANSNAKKIKSTIFDIVFKCHEFFAIPPQEISDLAVTIAADAMGQETLVSFYNNLFAKKRGHGSNDFTDLLKAKEIVDQYGGDIVDDEKQALYMNLAYVYEALDYKKSLEYLLVAETFGDRFIDEIICKKAAYYISLGNKKEFFACFKRIKDPQIALDLKMQFSKSFPHDTPPILKVSSVKNTKPSKAQKAERGIKQKVLSDDKTGVDKEAAKESFENIMASPSSASAQKYLAATLLTVKSSSGQLELLREINKKYPLLRENSIFNPYLLVLEMKIFMDNKLFEEATEKLAETYEKLAPYGENIAYIKNYLYQVKYQLFYALAENLEFDKASEILQFFPEEREELSALMQKLKESYDSVSKKDEAEEHVEEVGVPEEEVDSAAANTITLPQDVSEFTKQVSLGAIPLEALSGKLIHAYFMCKRAMTALDMCGVDSNSFINWDLGDIQFSTLADDSANVVKLNAVPNNYIAIDPRLNLEGDELEAAERVLNMARIARKKDQPGVKLVKGSFFELKILGDFGDLRLIADQVFDSNGNRLILFNRKGTHKDVITFAQEAKGIKVHSLKSEVALGGPAEEASVDLGQEYYSQVIAEESNVLSLGAVDESLYDTI